MLEKAAERINKVLDSDFLVYYLVGLLILKLLLISFFIWFPKTELFAEINHFLLIELTNKERIERGLPPLTENRLLNKAALFKARDMLSYDYFSHFSPNGTSPWHWFNKAGYSYDRAGENLGIGFLDTEEIYNAWKNSLSHRENLLNPGYREIGISVLTGEFKGNKTTLVVQFFASPAEALASASAPDGAPADKKENLPAEAQSAETEALVETEEVKETTTTTPTTSWSVSDTDQPKMGFAVGAMGFFKFMTLKYSDLIQKVIYLSLILLVLALLFVAFVSFRAKTYQPGLILRMVFFILFIGIFALLDKEILIKMIPHSLGI